MPYCSLEEAWAPVSYPSSDLYGPDNKSIYKNNCPQPKDSKMKYLGRTNQRLAQHNGPINRVPNYKNQVLKYSGPKNERIITDAEESVNNLVFNYDNQETPYTEFDNNYLYNNEKPDAPIHEIKLRKKSKKSRDDSVDSLEKIIQEVERTKEHLNDDDEEDDETIDSNSLYKELNIEVGDEKNIIKYLLEQNEKLKALLKKSSVSKTKSTGVFNIWDFIIVLILGIIMIIVLDYVYRIAIKKSI